MSTSNHSGHHNFQSLQNKRHLKTAHKRHFKKQNPVLKHPRYHHAYKNKSFLKTQHRNESANRTVMCHFHFTRRHNPVENVRHHPNFGNTINSYRHYAHCPYKSETGLPRNFIYQSPGSHDQLIVSVEDNPNELSKIKEEDLLRESKSLIYKMIHENNDRAVHKIIGQFMQGKGKDFLRNAMNLMQYGEQGGKSMASFMSTTGLKKTLDKKKLIENKRILIKRIIKKTEALLKAKDDKLLKEAIYLINSVQGVIQRMTRFSEMTKNDPMKSLIHDKKKLIKTIISKTQKLIKDKNDNILNGAISLVHRVLSKVYSERQISSEENLKSNVDTKTAEGVRLTDSHPDNTTTQTLVNVLGNITNKVDEQMKNVTNFEANENRSNSTTYVRISSLDKLKQEMLKMTGDYATDKQSGIESKELTSQTKSLSISQNDTANHINEPKIFLSEDEKINNTNKDASSNQSNSESFKESANQNNSASMDYMLNELMSEFNIFAEKVEKYEKNTSSSDKIDSNITHNTKSEEKKTTRAKEGKNFVDSLFKSDEELIKEFVSSKSTTQKNSTSNEKNDSEDSSRHHSSQKPEINVDFSDKGLEKIGDYIVKEIDKSPPITFHANIKPNSLSYFETLRLDGLAHFVPNFPINNKRDEKVNSRKNKDKALVRKKVVRKKTVKKKENSEDESINIDVIKSIFNEKKAESARDDERSGSYRYVHKKACSPNHKSCSKSRLQRDSEHSTVFDAEGGSTTKKEDNNDQKEDILSARDMTTFTIRKPKNMSLKIEMTPSNAIILIKDPVHKRKIVNHMQNKDSISKQQSQKNENDQGLHFANDAKEVMNELVSLVKETAVESEDLITNLKSNIENDTTLYNGTLPVLTNASSFENGTLIENGTSPILTNASSYNLTPRKDKKIEPVESALPQMIAKAFPIEMSSSVPAQNNTNMTEPRIERVSHAKISQNATSTYVFTDTADEGDDVTSDPQIGIGIKMLKASHASSEYVGSGDEGSGTNRLTNVDNTAVSPRKKTVILNEAVNHQLQKELYGNKENQKSLEGVPNVREMELEGDDEEYTTLYPMQYNGSSSAPFMFTETEKNGLKEANYQHPVDHYVIGNLDRENENENEDNNEEEENSNKDDKDDKEGIPLRLVLGKSKNPNFIRIKSLKIKKPSKVHFLEAYKNMDLAQKTNKANHDKKEMKDKAQMYDYYVDDSIPLQSKVNHEKDNELKKKHKETKKDSSDKEGAKIFLNEYLYEGIDTNELVNKLINQHHPAVLSNPIFHENKKVKNSGYQGILKIGTKEIKKKKKSRKPEINTKTHEYKINSLLSASFDGSSDKKDTKKKVSEMTDHVANTNLKSSNLLDDLNDDVNTVQSKDNLLLTHINALLELRKDINATLSKVLPAIETPKHVEKNTPSKSNVVSAKGTGKKTKTEKKVSPKIIRNDEKVQQVFNNMSVHMDNVLLQETIGKNASEQILEKNLEKKVKDGKLVEKAKDLENEILLQMVSKKLNKKAPLRSELKRIQNNLKNIGDTKTDFLKQLDEQKGNIVEMKNNVVPDSVKNEIDEHAALVDEVKKDLEKKLDKIMQGDETENVKELGPIQTTSIVLNYPPNKLLIGNKTNNLKLSKQIQAFKEMEKVVNDSVKDLPTRPPPIPAETDKDIYPVQTNTVKIEENAPEKTYDEILADHIDAFRKMGKQINSTLQEMNINITIPKKIENNTFVKEEEKVAPPAPSDFYAVNEKILTPGPTLREINTTLAELDQLDDKPEQGKKGIGSFVPNPSTINMNVNVNSIFASKQKENKTTDEKEEETTEKNFYTENKKILNPYKTLNEINSTLAELDEADKNDTEKTGLKNRFDKILPNDNKGQYSSMGPYQTGSLLESPAFDEMNQVINNTLEGMFTENEKYSNTKTSFIMFNKPRFNPNNVTNVDLQEFDKADKDNKDGHKVLMKKNVKLKSGVEKKEVGQENKTFQKTPSPVATPEVPKLFDNNDAKKENTHKVAETKKVKEEDEIKQMEKEKENEKNKRKEQQAKESNLEEQNKVKEALSKMMHQQIEVKQLLSKMLNETEEQKIEKNKGEELLSKLIEAAKNVRSEEAVEQSHGLKDESISKNSEKSAMTSNTSKKSKKDKSKTKMKKEDLKKLKEEEIRHLESEQDKKLKLAYLKLVQGSDKKEQDNRGRVRNPDDGRESGSGQSDMEPTMDRIVNLITSRFGKDGKLSNVFKGIEAVKAKHTTAIAQGEDSSSGEEVEGKEETLELMGGLADDDVISVGNNHKTIHETKTKTMFKPKQVRKSKNHTLNMPDFDTQGIDIGIPSDVAESIHHFYSNENTKPSHSPRVESPELTTQKFNSTHMIRFLDFSKLLGRNKEKMRNITTNPIADDSVDVEEKPAQQEPALDAFFKPDLLLMEKGIKTTPVRKKKKKENVTRDTSQMDIEKMYNSLINKINGDEGMETNLGNSYEHDINNKNGPPSVSNDIQIISSAYKDDRGKKEKLAKDVLNPQKKEGDILLSSFPDYYAKRQKKTKKPLTLQDDTETSSLPIIVEHEIEKMFNSEIHEPNVKNSKHINDTFLDNINENAMTLEKSYNIFHNLTAAKRSASIRPVKGRHRNNTDPYATIGDNIFVPFGQ